MSVLKEGPPHRNDAFTDLLRRCVRGLKMVRESCCALVFEMQPVEAVGRMPASRQDGPPAAHHGKKEVEETGNGAPGWG